MSEIKMDLPPLEERPLVTFALFAYNQEKYIREAVEGAFAQTYQPLEIILSDDCSMDNTHAIMCEMASEYHGPHTLIVNRSQSNRGLGAHIREVSNMSRGSIIVLAAGDDISCDSRTKLIVESFLSAENICAVFSDMKIIDEYSECIQFNSKSWSEGEKIDLLMLIRRGGGIGPGASYAYRRECFFWPWKLPEFIISEDRLLPFRAKCLGDICYIPKATVSYRIIKESLSRKLIRMNKLAFQDRDHLDELSNTINAARSQGYLDRKLERVTLRALGQMPKYAELIRKDSELGGLGLVDRLVYNWIVRDTLFKRINERLLRRLRTIEIREILPHKNQ